MLGLLLRLAQSSGFSVVKKPGLMLPGLWRLMAVCLVVAVDVEVSFDASHAGLEFADDDTVA